MHLSHLDLPALQRRTLLRGATATAAACALAGCGPAPRDLPGGFTGIDMARGHALRDRLQKGGTIEPDIVRRTQVVVAGGGVAGLAAARALRLAGIDDFMLVEMEDSAGGNSRAGQVDGIACPLGAHYLPVPGDGAREVQDLLEELGLRRRVAGRWQIDERSLCHSPQERLFFRGAWQEGLLPVNGVGADTLEQYRRFSARVAELGRTARFAMPTFKLWRPDQPVSAALRSLDAVTFDAWLSQEGFSDAHLRWYLDYCCRDDYGAGTARVSAWAGIHYFASRHGFHAPGDAASEERDGVLTWPEGNGWLAQRLAAPVNDAGALRTGSTVLRIEENRRGVEVDVLHHASDSIERWQARRCVVALPVFVAARVVRNPPAFLSQAAQRLQWAPWLVANLRIDAPLSDREGAAPAWDNVLYDDPAPGGLGYVDAGHQRLDPRPGPTVLTYYRALGDVPDGRRQLAEQPWTHWRDAILASLSGPHPDLRARVTRVEITRYGHAMSIPVPGTLAFLSQAGRMPAPRQRYVLANGERIAAPSVPGTARLAFAHADWSGYSVFEEAFTRGHAAGMAAAA
ncbi:FAD-dependent oxidoreductase [Paracidovorax avenae]|uniref:FAD-dependent oxidoreductase n=1 Tax=Paracidovorax avenae TaxID=80867 RepID=UPI000ADF07D1|nr:FAD-dependent oxidoreductase [Paracidovorax avenae]